MKKYLFILAGLLCLVGQGEAEAKALKLGRGRTLNAATNVPNISDVSGGGIGRCEGGSTCQNSGEEFCYEHRNDTTQRSCYCLYHPAAGICKTVQNCGTFCFASKCEMRNNEPYCTRCQDGYYAVNGVCKKCPANSFADGSGGCTCDPGYFNETHSTEIVTCKACSTINVPNGSAVECTQDAGKVTSANCPPSGGIYYYQDYSYAHNYAGTSDHQDVCQPVDWTTMTCAEGYRRAPSETSCTDKPGSRKCIPMCKDVTCVGGFAPTIKDGKCCCELKDSIEHCTAYDAGLCTHCESGYYLNQSTNTCVACGAHSSCDGSSTHLVCESGYFVLNSHGCFKSWAQCVKCPAHATCPGGDEGWRCDQGYYPIRTITKEAEFSIVNSKCKLTKEPEATFGCAKCPKGCAVCTGRNTCTMCDYGYTLIGNRCIKLKPIPYMCLKGMVWHPALRRCVYPVCVMNCAEPDQTCQSGYCTSCMPGYYLTSHGGCAACSSLTPHCTRCGSAFKTDTGLFKGAGCTACAKGYKLVGGECQSIQVPLPEYREEAMIELETEFSFFEE